MVFKYKQKKEWVVELKEAIQQALNDDTLGIVSNFEGIKITDINGEEKDLSASDISKIKNLPKFKEKLE